mmetsp:Transcript_26680/g.54631  ORF Transcript_26680/g.54631 Transcript_26680/m.54631 type:complete len:364 (+) Transcript_26680:1424-2515(+)
MAQGWERCAHSEVVGHAAVCVEGAVEVHAHKHLLVRKTHVADGAHAARCVDFVHGARHADHLCAVAPLVVVPQRKLHRVGGELEALVEVHDRGLVRADKVGRHGLRLAHRHHVRVARFRLQLLHHELARNRLVERHVQVEHGAVVYGDADRRAHDFAFELRDEVVHRLGGPRGVGDDVVEDGAARALVHVRLVDDGLRRRRGVDGQEVGFADAAAKPFHRGQKGQQARRGARGDRDNLLASVLPVVDAVHKHWSGLQVLGRGGEQAVVDVVALHVFGGEEGPRGFKQHGHAVFSPSQLLRCSRSQQLGHATFNVNRVLVYDVNLVVARAVRGVGVDVLLDRNGVQGGVDRAHRKLVLLQELQE